MSFLGLEYVNPVSIELVREEFVSESIRGARTGTVFGPGRWHVQATLEPEFFSVASHRLAVHRAKHGSLTSFTIPMPQFVDSDHDDADNFSTSGAASAGASSVNLAITISGTATSRTLKVGRFIKFANHTKVYQVDGSSDYSLDGTATSVQIVPELVAAVPETAAAAWTMEPDLTCRYEEESGGFASVNRRSIVTRSISVVEV